MKKRGISPLIATVLLIGFTIVLSAMVMRWGGTLFKTQTEQTSEAIDIEDLAIGVDFSVDDIKIVNELQIKMLIGNKARHDISGFIVRIQGENQQISTTIEDTIPAYSSKYVYANYDYWENGDIENINTIPKVMYNNEPTPLSTASYSINLESTTVEHEIGPTPNTIAMWYFDEDSGTTAYDAIGNHNGTLTDGGGVGTQLPQFVPGYINYGLEFYGDEYVEVTADSSLKPEDFTVRGWFKINDFYPTTYGEIFDSAGGSGWNGGMRVLLRSDGKILYQINLEGVNDPTNLYSSGTALIDEFNYFKASYNQNQHKACIFLNGDEDCITNPSYNLRYVTYVSDNLYIGGSGYWFDGIIDEVIFLDTSYF